MQRQRVKKGPKPKERAAFAVLDINQLNLVELSQSNLTTTSMTPGPGIPYRPPKVLNWRLFVLALPMIHLTCVQLRSKIIGPEQKSQNLSSIF